MFGATVFLAFSSGFCQKNRPYLDHTESPRLYFSVPATAGLGHIELVASSAQRDLTRPLDLSSADTRTVLQLRGDVEVTMCSPLRSLVATWA